MREQDWAIQIVSQCTGRPTILELGAHHGHDTVSIYDACKTEPVYIAVEADSRNIPVLRSVIDDRRVVVVHAAIADHDGIIAFHQCEAGDNGSGSILTPKRHLEYFPNVRFEQVTNVECITLDSLTARYNVSEVDLIWCDIQGAERLMIAGGQRTLSKTRWLLVEADAVEMYEGQAVRAQFDGLLPDFWAIDEWPENANVLFRNRKLL